MVLILTFFIITTNIFFKFFISERNDAIPNNPQNPSQLYNFCTRMNQTFYNILLAASL